MQNKESQNIEYKESWRDEYLKWICGFANAQGGKIYIGVNDKQQIIGVDNAKRLMEDIPNKVVNYLGIVVDVNLNKKKNKEYVEILVSPSNIPIALKGVYHYRSGSTKQELKGVALQEFILKKMGRSWDDVENERASLDDIDRSVIDYFLKKAIASNRMPKDSIDDSTEDILSNLNLITDDGKLKNAALLLFGKRPSKFFTSTDFRLGRFIKDDSDLIFQDIIEGNILQMADKVIDILRSKYLTSPISYQGLTRIEQLEIPEDALRELIFNAIIHKDYTGVHTQLKVFNDYIWLWNYGELPDNLLIEDLLSQHTSHPRNRNIANVFYKAGFIESWGRGIGKVTREFLDVGLNPPQFRNSFGGLLVIIGRPQNEDNDTINEDNDTINEDNDTINVDNDTINEDNDTINVDNDTINRDDDMIILDSILKLISKEEGINRSKIAKETNRSVSTVSRYIRVLRNRDMIEFKGALKTGGYYLKKGDEE